MLPATLKMLPATLKVLPATLKVLLYHAKGCRRGKALEGVQKIAKYYKPYRLYSAKGGHLQCRPPFCKMENEGSIALLTIINIRLSFHRKEKKTNGKRTGKGFTHRIC